MRKVPLRRSRTGAGTASVAPADSLFRQIVASMRNGVLAINRAGEVALMNEEAYRVFDLTPKSDDIGKSVAEVLRRYPEIVRVLLDVFTVSLLPNRAELRLRPLGRVIGYTLTLVRNDAGDIIGAAMFFKDLTRVEQLEERERLRDRLAAVGQMAAAIAHEVKNPLAGIEVNAGLLRRKISESPDAQAMLTGIIHDAKMANAIVQEVLDFVRPIRLQVEYTSIADAVQAAVHQSENQARGGVGIKVSIPPALPRIQADGYQLTQLLTNLLTNAYEAMSGEGQVTIAAQPWRLEDGADGREAVLIEVADNGPGMEREVASRVFEPFYTTKSQGSGLGLAIVRKIVDAHDGKIDMKTSPGTGTAIRVTLPVSSDTSTN